MDKFTLHRDSVDGYILVAKDGVYMQMQDVVALLNLFEAENLRLRAELAELRARSTHCDNCGCDWLDNGLNPVGCPYCKPPAGGPLIVLCNGVQYV